ncbi:hypothetical protein ACTJIJ_12845 [Niabella sp. 22666]|uniref:hypothetical protein n=1 Tax=Niabella sp. 22666 TaxID=3453954 RepID=UPI003F872FED
MTNNRFILLLLFSVFSSAAQTIPNNIYKRPIHQSTSSTGCSAQDSLHYLVYGSIFDTTGITGLQRVHVIVSRSGLPFDIDTVSTFTDDTGAYRLWLPERLRKYSILYLSINPTWGYKSLQAISFRTSQLPYKYAASLTFQKTEKFIGCGGGVKMNR